MIGDIVTGVADRRHSVAPDASDLTAPDALDPTVPDGPAPAEGEQSAL